MWIDRRPIFVLILARFRKQLLAVGALVATLFLIHMPPPRGLDVAGWRVLCLFLLCVTYWVTNLIPLSITSLVAMAGLPLLGVMSAREAYANFSNPVVFFVLGAFMIGGAVVGCGLSTRVAVWVLERFGKSPRRLIFAVYALCASMSCLMSEHAVAAMMFPIVLELVRGLGLKHGRSPMAKALVFALAWGCIVGGTLTFLGGGRGPLAVAFLEEMAPDRTVLFGEYILWNLPLVALHFCAGALLLYKAFPPEITSVEPAREKLRRQIHLLGKLSWREQAIGLILVVTVVLWATLGHDLGLGNIALLGVGAIFLLRLASWRDIEENVNWGILLTYGGAISLGAAMGHAGTAQWLTDHIFAVPFESPKALLLTIGAVVMLLTEFMSNSAVIAIMMPTALTLAASFHLDPRVVTMAVVLPSNFAFMLPAATPATAMAYSSGTFSPLEGMRHGFTMDLLGFALLTLLVLFYWPMVGLL